MKKYFTIFIIFLSSIVSTNLAANDLDDALSGFDDVDNTPAYNPENMPTDLDENGFDTLSVDDTLNQHVGAHSRHQNDRPYSLHGYTSMLSAYNYAQENKSLTAANDMPMDFSGLSRLRAKAGLSLEIKHNDNWRSNFDIIGWYDSSWHLNDKQNYTQEVLDVYEYFFDIKDAYIQGSVTKNMDIKFGRQIVIWGKSDSIRITDLINPLDNREAGMVDIEDLRLSETMTRLDYYFGNWGLSSIIIHEPRLDIEAAFGSDYRPSDLFGTPIPYQNFPDRIDPAWNLANTQYALSLDGRFSGWDISYYAAHIYDNRFSITDVNNRLIRDYNKIRMIGFAANFVSGQWLLKTEAAFLKGINYRSTDRKNRLDALIGFDYMAYKDTVISLELANRHIFNYEETMLTMTLANASAQGTFPDFTREDSIQIALRTSYTFDHDNATVTYLLSLAGGRGPGDNFDGGFQRLWFDYKYTDTISLNIGIVDYLAGETVIPFYRAIENNDRVFSNIKYSF